MSKSIQEQEEYEESQKALPPHKRDGYLESLHDQYDSMRDDIRLRRLIEGESGLQ